LNKSSFQLLVKDEIYHFFHKKNKKVTSKGWVKGGEKETVVQIEFSRAISKNEN